MSTHFVVPYFMVLLDKVECPFVKNMIFLWGYAFSTIPLVSIKGVSLKANFKGQGQAYDETP